MTTLSPSRPDSGAATEPRGASFVVLTRGDRPDELAAALGSVREQQGIVAEIIVVWNGVDLAAPPETLGGDVNLLVLERNVGIPAGRNIGIAAARHEHVFLLDDDARYATRDVAAVAVDRMAASPRLAVISFRVRDPETGLTQRRHVPRLGAGNPSRSSRVTTFLGGACVLRRGPVLEVGGFPDDFFYAHEETDLAWRLLDRGLELAYAGDLVVLHPATQPARHPEAAWRSARNRVWLARRNLPAVLGVLYVSVWFSLTMLRADGVEERRQAIAGFRAGIREPCGVRRPLQWRTVLRMMRLGRPPII